MEIVKNWFKGLVLEVIKEQGLIKNEVVSEAPSTEGATVVAEGSTPEEVTTNG